MASVLGTMREVPNGKRLEVTVSYDAERGYVASAPELRQPVTALSLGGLHLRTNSF
jgi:hypothetical protein